MEYRRAKKEEIPDVMQFIEKYWKKDHILAMDREFFDWMYVDEDKVNFYIAIEDGKIYGINGIIIYNSQDNPSISGALWKVIKCGNPMLGLELAEAIWEEIHNECAYGIGLNVKTAVRIAKLNGDEVGKMKHFYRLGDKKDYQIAVVNNKIIPKVQKGSCQLILLSENEFSNKVKDSILRMNRPYKDKKYLIHRYFNHPIYKYQVYGIQRPDGSMESFLVGRKVEYNHSRILKLVDFIGYEEDLCQTGYALEKLIEENDYEYVDMYCTGLEKKTFEQMGFIYRDEKDENIIPNYFEPFEQKNVDIYYGAPDLKGIKMFRGDGDQDRPSYSRKMKGEL
ncbi:MAG TPA: hypothetical protein DHV96_12080 [Lachnospiraceae bacterium]|nr:hypothetical protein [Lachnospiraceae bacterium]